MKHWHSLNEQAFIEVFEKIKWKEILKLGCLYPHLSFEAFISTIIISNRMISSTINEKITSHKKEKARKSYRVRKDEE